MQEKMWVSSWYSGFLLSCCKLSSRIECSGDPQRHWEGLHNVQDIMELWKASLQGLLSWAFFLFAVDRSFLLPEVAEHDDLTGMMERGLSLWKSSLQMWSYQSGSIIEELLLERSSFTFSVLFSATLGGSTKGGCWSFPWKPWCLQRFYCHFLKLPWFLPEGIKITCDTHVKKKKPKFWSVFP